MYYLYKIIITMLEELVWAACIEMNAALGIAVTVTSEQLCCV